MAYAKTLCSRRRPPVFSVDDFQIGSADAYRSRLDKHRSIRLGRLREVSKIDRPGFQREDCDRSHDGKLVTVEREHLETGRLLVANPLLPDPNFDRTVVLLLAYNDEGALGLVLNRPSETSLKVPLAEWQHLAASPQVVFVGGPVDHRTVICLARSFTHPAGSNPPGGWTAVTHDVGTLDMDLDPDGLQTSLSEVRFFAGYAGWGSGQLEGEIAAGAWWVVDGEASDIFCDDPDRLWKTVLRRQHGALALVSAYPEDPTFN